MNFEKILSTEHILKFLLFIIAASVVVHIGLLIFTRFERTITIDSTNTFGSGGGRSLRVNNMVTDKEGRTYAIRNVLLLLHFRAAEVQAKLKTGQTYTVRGYGLRVPFLGLYPTITAAGSA
jgi:hypothetical protein